MATIRKKVAILATNGFEESELKIPRERLRERGHQVDIVSPDAREIKSWAKGNWSASYPVDVELSDASVDDYDMLVLPGGVINPDKLRMNEDAVYFVRTFFDRRVPKPVAAICHGPWLLINADMVMDRELTSYSSIRLDLENAGAHWKDKEVVIDDGLITSRSPDDLDAFCREIINLLEAPVRSSQETIHSPYQM